MVKIRLLRMIRVCRPREFPDLVARRTTHVLILTEFLRGTFWVLGVQLSAYTKSRNLSVWRAEFHCYMRIVTLRAQVSGFCSHSRQYSRRERRVAKLTIIFLRYWRGFGSITPKKIPGVRFRALNIFLYVTSCGGRLYGLFQLIEGHTAR